MVQVGETLKAGSSLIGKVYRFLWLVTFIGFLVTLGGFYFEFRKVSNQITEVTSKINSLGEHLMGAGEWKEKAASGVDELRGKGGDLLKKIGK